jgi:hypothetical protein
VRPHGSQVRYFNSPASAFVGHRLRLLDRLGELGDPLVLREPSFDEYEPCVSATVLPGPPRTAATCSRGRARRQRCVGRGQPSRRSGSSHGCACKRGGGAAEVGAEARFKIRFWRARGMRRVVVTRSTVAVSRGIAESLRRRAASPTTRGAVSQAFRTP